MPSFRSTATTSWFISGTDTGVGKTWVTAALAAGYLLRGLSVAVYKPVQTGVTPGAGQGDADWVAQRLAHRFVGLTTCCGYEFVEPAAPSVADPQGTVSIERLRRLYQELVATHDVVLVEGAGGLLVPVRPHWLMVDLARRLQLDTLLVCRPHLGTLNHTLMSAEALHHRGMRCRGVVLNEGERPLSVQEKESMAVQTAAEQLRTWLPGTVAVVDRLPHLPGQQTDGLLQQGAWLLSALGL